MMNTARFLSRCFAVVGFLAVHLVFASVCFGQGGSKKQRGPQIHTDVLPMFQIAKMVEFPLQDLKAPGFEFSRAELAMLPAGFSGIKKPQHIVYVTYAWRPGGLVRFYETPVIPHLPKSEYISTIADSRIYHDSYHNERFVSKTIFRGNVAIVFTSLDSKILADAVRIMSK